MIWYSPTEKYKKKTGKKMLSNNEPLPRRWPKIPGRAIRQGLYSYNSQIDTNREKVITGIARAKTA